MGSKSKENIVLDRKHGPIFYNAVRLFDDAKILRKARRYPSSAALAILSLEELGKFLVHDNDFTSWISPRHMREKHQYHHREKQRLAAEALIWILGVDEIRALAKSAGYYAVWVPASEASGRVPTMLEIISSIDETKYGKRRRVNVRNIKNHQSVIELAKGNFDRIKQESFYVDVVDGKLRLPEATVDRLTADRLISMASAAIFATKQMLRRFSKRKTI